MLRVGILAPKKTYASMSGYRFAVYQKNMRVKSLKERKLSMKKTNLMRLFSLMLVFVVVAAMMFTLVSCGNNNGGDNNAVSGNDGSDTEREEVTITVKIKNSNGVVTDFVITTSEEFLRGALEQENLVEGDESAYGLYVKVVNGERADYDADGAYWSFYKDGAYLSTGIDATPIADGDVFSIEYTKG